MARTPTAFREMASEHLKCRGLQHAWDVELVTVRREEGRKLREAVLVCMRCGANKHVVTFADGVYARHSAMAYPDGYLVKDLASWGGRGELLRNARAELYGRYENNGGRESG